MGSILSVQNRNFSADGKEFTNVSRAVGKAQSYLHWQFIGIWQILWRVILESSNFDTSSIRDEWYCWKSGTQSKRRNVGCAVAVGRGWTMVGWFCGMSLFSAIRSGPLIGQENTSWTAIWRTILRPSNSFWSSGLNIIRFLHDTSQGFTNLARTCCQAYSSEMH